MSAWPDRPSTLLTKLQCGELRSESLTQYLTTLNQQHASLNALCLPRFEHASIEAKHCDALLAQQQSIGPLHGLPITIKECFDLRETPSTFGLVHRTHDFPDSDDIYVDALRQAGAVILGKSNVSQLLVFIETDNPVYGTTSQPNNPAFSCGGSSGGEGALVGAGLSPLGIGTDVGGSVRVPAAVNGACAIKPTGQRLKDRTRLIPGVEDLPIPSAVGPISQDARTLQIALDIMNQAASQRWDVEPLRDFKDVQIADMNIGFFVEDAIFPVSEPVRRAVMTALDKLEGLGATVTEYRYPDLREAEALFYGGMSVDDGQFLIDAMADDKPAENISLLMSVTALSRSSKRFLAALLAGLGQRHQSRILRLLGRYRSADVSKLHAEIRDYTARVIASMQNTSIGQLDAVVSPILPVPAYLHNSFKDMGLAGTYSLINNVTGFPAGIACVGTVKETRSAGRFSAIDLAERRAKACCNQSAGLPMSVQISALPWREDNVLALIDALHVPFTQALNLAELK